MICNFVSFAFFMAFTFHAALADPAGGAKPQPKRAPGEWLDGHVTVRWVDAPVKRQDFVVTVPAPVEEVWRVLTTNDGMKNFFPCSPDIELKPGGKYEIHGGTGNKVLSYMPMEMLSVTGSAPKNFPNVRKGGTWAVYRFEPLGSKTTRVALGVVGWKAGEPEWDGAFEYFLGGNAIYLNAMYDHFAKINGELKPEDDAATAKHDRVYSDAPSRTTAGSHLAPMSRIIGTWESRHKEANGTPVVMRVTNEWGLGGKVLKGKSYVVKDGNNNLVYETWCTWHPQKKAIVFQSASSWDALYVGTVADDGGVLKYEWDGFTGNKTESYRQTIRFPDGDHYVWTVFTKTDKGWEQSKESTYARVAG